MVLDKFGRNNKRSATGVRGPPGPSGEGFSLTVNGNYDVKRKKVINLAQPDDDNDAANKIYIDVTLENYHQLTNKQYFECKQYLDKQINLIKDELKNFEENMNHSYVELEEMVDKCKKSSEESKPYIDKRIDALQAEYKDFTENMNQSYVEVEQMVTDYKKSVEEYVNESILPMRKFIHAKIDEAAAVEKNQKKGATKEVLHNIL